MRRTALAVISSAFALRGDAYPNIASGADVALAYPIPGRWFNTTAFSAPPPYTIGTAPRRIPQLREDSQHKADLAILKNFRPIRRSSDIRIPHSAVRPSGR